MAQQPMPAGVKFIMGSPLGKLLQNANIWAYRASKGKLGASIQGAPVLLLTTRGRKTGQPRTAPLLYIEDGQDLVIVASKGGWPDHPLWYKNLQATPDVDVQVGPTLRAMTSRTADPAERARLWPRLVARYKDYENYQTWTDREIPVVVLTDRK